MPTLTRKPKKQAKQKITVEVPKNLLKQAQKETGAGITETVTQGLEKLSQAQIYKELLKLKGSSPNLEIDLNELREDRDYKWSQ